MIIGKLTAKQDRFCEEYLLDLNATQAAIRAGYSKKTVASMGNENLDKPEIMRNIFLLKIERIRRTRIRADRVVKELEKIAFAAEGVKISDKIKALGMLGKHMGLFEKPRPQLPNLTLEDIESNPFLNGIHREDWNIYDAMPPKERERMFGAVDRYFGKSQDEEQETTTETGLEAGDSDEDEIDDFVPED